LCPDQKKFNKEGRWRAIRWPGVGSRASAGNEWALLGRPIAPRSCSRDDGPSKQYSRTAFMKRPKSTSGLDPLKIFDQATRFHESDHRLRNTVPTDRPDQLPLVAYPAMVLSALASELYLKCLLCIETGAVPNTHNLKELFNGLKSETKRKLEALWQEDIKTPQRQKVINHIRTLPDGKGLKEDLIYALDLGADAFIELRYIYENGRSFFLLGEFPNMLRQVLLERFPELDRPIIPPTPAA
jgi:hypothetical protein